MASTSEPLWFLSAMSVDNKTELLAWRGGERLKIKRSGTGLKESTGAVTSFNVEDSKNGILQVRVIYTECYMYYVYIYRHV